MFMLPPSVSLLYLYYSISPVHILLKNILVILSIIAYYIMLVTKNLFRRRVRYGQQTRVRFRLRSRRAYRRADTQKTHAK